MRKRVADTHQPDHSGNPQCFHTSPVTRSRNTSPGDPGRRFHGAAGGGPRRHPWMDESDWEMRRLCASVSDIERAAAEA
jgi:hypothetical protein